VSFHGGVPSEKRPALVERVRDDPACRVFLSTDAGSTGLNLQHASALVNMDLPWNPAVLEQRIARIHRIGQARPVQVINFVAKGTIEEGMLSVLAFKRSLSAGDGGSGEISLGGSRLNRFMKDVENVTGSMGEGEALTPAEEIKSGVAVDAAASVEDADADAGGDAQADIDAAAMAAARTGRSGAALHDTGPDPWQSLVQVGAQFVAALAAANNRDAAEHPWIERNPTTGAQSLKIPLPPPETARQLANALSALADSLRGGIA
jgi:superfamily II DNA/RNA helicase